MKGATMFNLEKLSKKMAELKSDKPEHACIYLRIVGGEFTDGLQSYGSKMQGKIESISSEFGVAVRFWVGEQLYRFTVPKNSVIDSLVPYRSMLCARGLDEQQVTTAIEIKGKRYSFNRIWFSRVTD